MTRRAVLAVGGLILSWLFIVGPLLTDPAGAAYAMERRAIALVLLGLSALATFEFWASQRLVVASRSRLTSLRSLVDWSELPSELGSTWVERAITRMRLTPATERLPLPQDAVAALRAEAETGGVVLRWFATGAVLVGLIGTLYGLGGSITEAVDLLKTPSSGDSNALAQGMAAALEPLTFCFKTSLLGVVVSLFLTLARIVQDAEIDAHMTDITDLLAERMSSSLFPDWQDPVARIEAAMVGLTGAAAQIAKVPEAMKEASVYIASNIAAEVRRELRGLIDRLTEATRDGLRDAGGETLRILAAQEEPRRLQTFEVAKQLESVVRALVAAETTIRTDHDHMLSAAVRLDGVHDQITKRTSELLVKHLEEFGKVAAGDRAAHAKEAVRLVEHMIAAQRAEAVHVTDGLNRQAGLVGTALTDAASLLREAADGQLKASRALATTTGTVAANLTKAAKLSESAVTEGTAATIEAAKSAAKAAETTNRAAAAVGAAAAGAFGTLAELRSETAATRGALEAMARRMAELADVELAEAHRSIHAEGEAVALAVRALLVENAALSRGADGTAPAAGEAPPETKP